MIRPTRPVRLRFRPCLLALEGRDAPAVLTVTSTSDLVPGSLRSQVAAAADGDTIQFDPSLSGQTVNLTFGEVAISKNLTIAGPGAGNLTVSGGNLSRVFSVAAGNTVAITDVTIANGFRGSSTDNGAGMSNRGTLTLSNDFLTGNATAGLGGAVYSDGTLTVNACTFSGNSAQSGGGLWAQGRLTITGGTRFLSNTATTRFGAALDVTAGATASIAGATFSANTAADPTFGTGGAVYNNGTLTIAGSNFAGNTARFGAAVANDTFGALTVDGCTLSNNTAATTGGGVYNAGILTVRGSTLTANSARFGGAVGNLQTLTAINDTLVANTAGLFGGGVYDEGTVTITNVTVTANQAASVGGGLFSFGGGTLTNTIVAGNTSGPGGSLSDDITGAVLAASANNLVGDGTNLVGIGNGVNGNQVGTAANPINAGLSFLNFNGGTTQTVALLAGSPAIGAGTTGPGVPTTDQQGNPRGTPPSIGATEYVAATVVGFYVAGPGGVTYGTPFGIFVVAIDLYGNPVVSYAGTIHFTCDDPTATLPADYTFNPSADGGAQTFTLTVNGSCTVTVSDALDPTLFGTLAVP